MADVMDRERLLAALGGVRADAVLHELTGLGTTKVRAAMRGTNVLRTTGTAHLLAPPGWLARTASSPSRTCSGTATGTTARA